MHISGSCFSGMGRRAFFLVDCVNLRLEFSTVEQELFQSNFVEVGRLKSHKKDKFGRDLVARGSSGRARVIQVGPQI